VCNTSPCPVDCVVSSWSDWGKCSKDCGEGISTRSRTVITPSANGGAQCPSLAETQTCNTQACPVNCVVSDWSDWSSCDKTCGGGVQNRTRIITQPAENGGTSCPVLSDSRQCNTSPCPVNCVVSDWGAWGTCDKTCGGGTQTKSRTVIQPANYGGQPCPSLEEQQACNIQGCPVNCVVSGWSDWSECDENGNQYRSRNILTESANGGITCPNLQESRFCPVNCKLSDWSVWSSCSSTCGGGTQTRNRSIIKPTINGGACDILTQSQICTGKQCPIDCKVSAWGPFGPCSEKGMRRRYGIKTRKRTVLIPSANGGANCPSLEDTTGCDDNGRLL
jgi:hypothetical protein